MPTTTKKRDAEPNPANLGPIVRCSYTRLMRVSDLKPNPRNPNKHSGRQLELYAKVIEHQGWRRAIVVSSLSGFIVTGHGAVETAKRKNWPVVPVDYQDFASEQDEAAHMLADNQLPELAELDQQEVSAILKELEGEIELDLTGFDSGALETLHGFSVESDVDTEPQVDRAAELQQEWKTERGQIWQLGEHRLMCGDSCTSQSVGELLSNDLIGLVWTDPPYGVSYEEKCRHLQQYRPQDRKSSVVENDEMAPDETESMVTRSLAHACDRALPGCVVYVACPAGPLHARFQSAIVAAGFSWKHTLVWVKNHFVMGRSDYHYRHEPILYGWKENGSHLWCGGRDKDTVFQVDKPVDSDLHPTMKPVELVCAMISNSSKVGSIVYEPFSGSGTTIIACERLNRKCRAMEISSAYVAVALQRYKDATGDTPKLL